MSRFAIGYSRDAIDHPLAVFVETDGGVLFQQRGDVGVQLLAEPFGSRPSDGVTGDMIGPEDNRYFDVVVDGFSTKYFIRTVTDLEPSVLATMLLAEGNWELLPRPEQRIPA